MKIASGEVRRVSDRTTLVVLRDDDGNEAQGEASPLEGFSRETSADCAAVLERAVETMVLEDLSYAPAARFALETALLGLTARRRGTTLASVLAGRPAVTDVPVNALLYASRGSLADRGEQLVKRGYRSLKVKLQAHDDSGFARELEALVELRARVGHDVEIRLDANGRYAIDEARRRLEALACVAPSFVEQPVAPQELDRLGPCAVPWAADESLVLPGMSERIDRAMGCVAFVLKPTMLGLRVAFSMGRRAQERDLDVSVTHAFEGPIAMAACRELACALAAFRPPIACGLAPHDRSVA